ncbi:hypothetical protein K450DRAFT_240221 [Umbelopsis ramanniana AG]|uniref:Uncharacterized protein n=1 Tax=Umbelopsis ramanniana AG TaxID=1314678 RepID=A0AAD5E990_UMBRA|nr:uncharacterized protein K450DRAFT_240221 [Umbelopsis ramanniana AG]KAI8579763.1 hypothetical protein K450DRAFT_240221 [Umbelopsis ramanniana AG]
MRDISSIIPGSHRIIFAAVVLLAMAPVSWAQIDPLTGLPPYASPKGKTTDIDSYPVAPTSLDWSTLIVRIVTQYFLWWLPDLFLMVLWQRQPVKLWLIHSMRKVFFNWRPGAVFVQSWQPTEATEAYRVILGGEKLPGLFPMLFTLATDGWTLASGGLSVYTQWVTSNHDVSGWNGIFRFYNPIVPSIVSFISIIAALCKASNKVRIYLIVAALIIWPAIFFPVYILHDSSHMYIMEIMVFIIQLNPFLIIGLELVSMVLIGLDRVFALPVIATSDIKRTGFPFPSLNNWAFGGPFLALGIVTLLFAEAGMMTSALEIMNYVKILQQKVVARFKSKKEDARPNVLPMHQVSDEPIESIDKSPLGKKDSNSTTRPSTSEPPSTHQRNGLQSSVAQTVNQPSTAHQEDLQITSVPSPTLTNSNIELQSRSPPPAYSSTTSTPRVDVRPPVQTIPTAHPTDSIAPNTQLDIGQIYHLITGRNTDGAQVDASTRRNT